MLFTWHVFLQVSGYRLLELNCVTQVRLRQTRHLIKSWEELS